MRLHLIPALLVVPLVSWTGVATAQDTTQAQQKQDRYTQPDSLRFHTAQAPISDATLLSKLHTNNQREIRLAQLAQRNARSAEVKSLGRTLVQDHQQADRKVTDVAKQLGIALPMDRGPGRQKKQAREQYPRDQQPDQQPGDTAKRSGDRSDTTATPNRIGQGQDMTGRFGPPQDTTAARFGQQQDTTAEKQQLAQEEQRLKSLRGAAFDTAFAQAMVNSHEKSIAMLERAQSQVQSNEVRSLISDLLPKLREHRQMAAALTQGYRTTSSSNQ